MLAFLCYPVPSGIQKIFFVQDFMNEAWLKDFFYRVFIEHEALLTKKGFQFIRIQYGEDYLPKQLLQNFPDEYSGKTLEELAFILKEEEEMAPENPD